MTDRECLLIAYGAMKGSEDIPGFIIEIVQTQLFETGPEDREPLGIGKKKKKGYADDDAADAES